MTQIHYPSFFYASVENCKVSVAGISLPIDLQPFQSIEQSFHLASQCFAGCQLSLRCIPLTEMAGQLLPNQRNSENLSGFHWLFPLCNRRKYNFCSDEGISHRIQRGRHLVGHEIFLHRAMDRKIIQL